jgi:hypothetical protein
MTGYFADKWQVPRHLMGSFTCRKSATWDRRLYFPSAGRHAQNFFALKNPTASVGFEPANVGTRSKHATHRPPKPLLQELAAKAYRTTSRLHLQTLAGYIKLNDSNCTLWLGTELASGILSKTTTQTPLLAVEPNRTVGICMRSVWFCAVATLQLLLLNVHAGSLNQSG